VLYQLYVTAYQKLFKSVLDGHNNLKQKLGGAKPSQAKQTSKASKQASKPANWLGLAL
jgi:hypothetical protein